MHPVYHEFCYWILWPNYMKCNQSLVVKGFWATYVTKETNLNRFQYAKNTIPSKTGGCWKHVSDIQFITAQISGNKWSQIHPRWAVKYFHSEKTVQKTAQSIQPTKTQLPLLYHYCAHIVLRCLIAVFAFHCSMLPFKLWPNLSHLCCSAHYLSLNLILKRIWQ